MLRGAVARLSGCRTALSAPLLRPVRAAEATLSAARAFRGAPSGSRLLSSEAVPASTPFLRSFISARGTNDLAERGRGRLRLEMPDGVGPLALNQIRDNYGARRKKRRLGRGVGSGRGRKSGRGQKGMRARSGNHGFLGRDGGQTKLQKAVPKMGHWRPQREYQRFNLESLEEAVGRGRLRAGTPEQPITVKDLFDARLVTLRGKHMGVTLLGRGAARFRTPVHIEVQMASQTAIDAVERAGGTISTVFYSRLTLRALLKPHRFEAAPVGHRHGGMRPRPALPPPKLMRDVYLTERYRGYLRQLKPGDVVRPHEHPEHADLSLRAKPRYPGWAAADEQARKEGAPLIDDDGSVIAGSSEDPRP